MKKLIKLLPALLLALPMMVNASDLDGDVIERWTSSMEELESWASTQEGLTEEDFVDESDPSNVELSMLRTVERNPDVQDIVDDNGFNDPEEWAVVGSRIINAYGSLMLEAEGGGQSVEEMRQQAEEQLAAMENNPEVPPEQLAMMEEQIEGSIRMLERWMNAPDEDVAVVRENMGQIDSVLQQPQ